MFADAGGEVSVGYTSMTGATACVPAKTSKKKLKYIFRLFCLWNEHNFKTINSTPKSRMRWKLLEYDERGIKCISVIGTFGWGSCWVLGPSIC